MAHILIDSTERCFCNWADKCVVKNKRGSSLRCTKEELEREDHKTVKVTDKKIESKLIAMGFGDSTTI